MNDPGADGGAEDGLGDVLTSIDGARGGDGDDILIGDSGANELDGNGGADSLRGVRDHSAAARSGALAHVAEDSFSFAAASPNPRFHSVQSRQATPKETTATSGAPTSQRARDVPTRR